MNNRNMYNPLFESLTDTARRYERVHEEKDPAYRLKSAQEYANKILQLAFNEYSYFVSSVPLPALKQELLKKNLDFFDGLATKTDLNIQGAVDAVMKEWESTAGSLMANQDLQKMSPAIKEIYTMVGDGMKTLKGAADIYLRRYSAEVNKPEVINSVKTFVANTIKALKEKNK